METWYFKSLSMLNDMPPWLLMVCGTFVVSIFVIVYHLLKGGDVP